jgi:hypothetical protein
MYFILLCRSNDGVTGKQAKNVEEMDKEDYMGSERHGMLNGPVPDVDTLEIGITKKEMGELLNCTKQNNIFVFHCVVYHCSKNHQRLRWMQALFVNDKVLLYQKRFMKIWFRTEGRIMHLCVSTHKYRVYLSLII